MQSRAGYRENRVRLALILGVVMVVAVMPATLVAGEIRWQSGAVETEFQSPQEAADAVAAIAGLRSGRTHFVAQFNRPIDDNDRAALESAGVTLLSYLGDNAFFASTSETGVNAATLAAVDALRVAMPIERDWKLHPDLANDVIVPWSIVEPVKPGGPAAADPIVAVYVVFHSDVSLYQEAADIVFNHTGSIRSYLASINGMVVELPASSIKTLADEDAVQYIEPPLPALEPNNDDNRLRTGADIVQASPYNLDGSGVTVLVYDGGTADCGHPDLAGHCTIRDSSGTHYHSTHVAGTVGGTGASSGGLYRGMAPGVVIESYGFEVPGGLQPGFLYTDPGDIEADYSEAISLRGADISNNSIGTNTAPNGYDCSWEGNYGITSALIDTIVRGDGSNPLFNQPFRIVWANGNERQGSQRCGATYHTTAPPACAKNHITVGALNSNDDSVTSFTSWGPTDDDRLKPDLAGPGCQSNGDNGVTSTDEGGGYTTLCGTSMASPTVCGLAALILQDFRAQFPGEPDPRNSTLKALLAHNAADIESPGPDYKTGYGSVRIQPTIDFMRTGNFIEADVTQGATYSVIVIVSPGDPTLKVTLAWDDVPGTPNVNPVLVNDLDLRVFDPSGTRHYPWTLGGLANPSAPAVQTQEDHVNNIEQVLVNAPAAGAWRVDILGYNVPQGPQPFSLAASPELVNCSDTGIIDLHKSQYPCESTASIKVVDCQLNTSDTVVDTVNVTVRSDLEPAGEVVTLTESAPESADFRGTITLSQTDATGVLQVGNGSTVTAEYIDADDGMGGSNVLVTDTASVDCVAPVISNVQTTNILPRAATVTFNTSEPAYGTVRHGLSCAALTESTGGAGSVTNHAITVSGLTDQTTYYYAVDAEDPAGNQTTADNSGACYSFTTPDIPDFFTEQFAGDNDLQGLTLTFEPNGTVDFYSGCVEQITAFPTDPSGGTNYTISDDGSATVTLTGGATVSLYGTSYSTFYVNANGNISFTASDSTYTESFEEHFSLPRVSALFDDLNPSDGGTVSSKQLADRVAVTWQGVPEYNTSGSSNTFQIELFFDGRIVISYLSFSATDGLAGLSAGAGVDPDFYESDLSRLGACGPKPPKAFSVQATTAVDVPTTVTLNATDDGLPEPPTVDYIVTSLPGNGSLSDPNGGAITSVPYMLAAEGNEVDYQPNAGFHNSDTFNYKANDTGTAPDGGDSNIATVTVVVGGAAWDPVANNVNTSTAVDTGTDITLDASDPNSDPLTYLIQSLPARGSLSDPNAGAISSVPYTLAAGGNVVHYDPPAGTNPPDTFTFAAHDATAGSNTATVTVTIGGPDWDPVAYDVTDSTAVSLTKVVSLDGWDPNGDPLTYFIESLPANGHLADPNASVIDSVPYQLVGGGNEVMYQPDCGQVLQDSFGYWAQDATAESNVADVSMTVSASDPRVVYDFPLNTDPGWSTEGEWAFGQPAGGGTHDYDPTSGYTGVNVYGYNLAGDYGRGKPMYALTTPPFDCSNLTGVELRFWRWLGVESFDDAKVQVSVNGVDWTTVWDSPSSSHVSDAAWQFQSFDLSAIADGASAVRIRWTMGPTDTSVTYPGWNIDDVQLWAIVPPIAADFNGDGVVKMDDFAIFSDCLSGPQIDTVVPCICVDLDADGDVDLQDFAGLQEALGGL